jgi:multidrug efflux pump subunit AcrB
MATNSRGASALVFRASDRQTAITLTGTLTRDRSLEQVKRQIEAAMAAFALPAGYSGKFGTDVEQSDDTQMAMLALALGQAQLAGGPGGSGPAYYPMARAIIGGLAFSLAQEY